MPRWARPLRRVRRAPPDSLAGGAVEVAYARILDGETLWLALRAPADAEVALRSGDQVIAVPTEVEGDLLTARVTLPTLVPDADLVDLLADGEPPRGLPPEEGPLATPPTRDGRWQYALETADDGELRVRRTARPPEATLLDARADETDAGLVLRLAVPTEVAATLLVLAEDGAVTAERPLGDDGSVLLDAGTVGAGALVTLAVGTPEHHVDVRRPRNALRFPGAAVVLPGLATPDAEEWSPYLRWLRDGRLATATANDDPGG